MRGADKEIFQMIKIITALKGSLEFLHVFFNNDDNKSRLPLLHSLCEPDARLEICQTALTDIESKLRPKRDHRRPKGNHMTLEMKGYKTDSRKF